jgi:hypothetical protein
MQASFRISAGAALLAGVLCCLLSGAEATHPTPVLVELFTSEGCSSCPPADRLLGTLDKLQPVTGVQIIVMSEHVDYWNEDGWVDRFSSHEFTLRQQEYDRQLKVNEPYTPEVIVDGSQECLGSEATKIEAAIREAAGSPKLSLRVIPSQNPNTILVEAEAPSGIGRGAEVFAAFAQETAESDVASGENHGQKLRHVAVVRKLRKLGKIGKNSDFYAEVPVAGLGGERLIAFVQEPRGGRVLAAALYRIP